MYEYTLYDGWWPISVFRLNDFGEMEHDYDGIYSSGYNIFHAIEWKLCDDGVIFYRSLLNILQITSELIIVTSLSLYPS